MLRLVVVAQVNSCLRQFATNGDSIPRRRRRSALRLLAAYEPAADLVHKNVLRFGGSDTLALTSLVCQEIWQADGEGEPQDECERAEPVPH